MCWCSCIRTQNGFHGCAAAFRPRSRARASPHIDVVLLGYMGALAAAAAAAATAVLVVVVHRNDKLNTSCAAVRGRAQPRSSRIMSIGNLLIFMPPTVGLASVIIAVAAIVYAAHYNIYTRIFHSVCVRVAEDICITTSCKSARQRTLRVRVMS